MEKNGVSSLDTRLTVCYNSNNESDKGDFLKEMGYYFNGRYEHQLDAKRRMRIPSKLRTKLGNNYSVTIGSDFCLWILPEEAACRLQDKLSEMDASDPQARAAKRAVLGAMFSPEEDSQGRFIIPKALANYAGIEKSVVLIGQKDYIEVWAAEKYAAYEETLCNVDIAQFIQV